MKILDIYIIQCQNGYVISEGHNGGPFVGRRWVAHDSKELSEVVKVIADNIDKANASHVTMNSALPHENGT